MSLENFPGFLLNFSEAEMNGKEMQSYTFKSFRLDLAERQLLKGDVPVPLTPKAFDVLGFLVSRSGHLVEKEDLMHAIWADSFVEEANMARIVHTLRKVLDEDENGNKFIETVAKKGYRFVAKVAEIRKENEKHSKNDSIETSIPKPANAYQAYQLARYHFNQLTPTDLIKSRSLLEEAVWFDADFAVAHAALAEQSVMEGMIGFRAPTEIFPKAKESLQRAAELNPHSTEFYTAAGFIDLICDWNFAQAEENLRKALELNPYNSFANNYLGQTFMFRCQPEKAEFYLRRAVEIEPLAFNSRIVLMIAYFLGRNYQKAEEECEKMLAVYPHFFNALWMRCCVWEQTGRAAEAIAEYEKILHKPDGELVRRWMGYAYALIGDTEAALATAARVEAERQQAYFISQTHLAALYAALKDTDKAISYLENAVAECDPWLLWLATDPRFDNLRFDPRFNDLIGSVGLDADIGSPKIDPAINPSVDRRLFATNNTYKIIAGVIGTAMVLMVVVFWLIRWPLSRIDNVKLRALTTSGNITFPAISPDGRFFAFVKSEGGKPSLWIRQVALRNSEIRLTEPKTDEIFVGVTLSPDGSKVYFLLKPRNNSVTQLYSVPIFGGETPKPILTDVDSPPAFDPTGKHFAFMRRDTKQSITALLIADEDGTNIRELTNRKPPRDFILKPLVWSPDGQTIACFSTLNLGSADRHLVLLDAQSGEEKYVSDQLWIWIDSVVWTKNDKLIYSASDKEKPIGLQLWSLEVATKTSHRLTTDLNDYTDLTFAADTGQISGVQAQWESYVWLQNLKSPELSRRISPNKSDGSQGIAWMPDGTLIFTSVINGKNSLQKVSMTDFSISAITADDKYVFRNPIVTPDGNYIVFTSNQSDPEGIWRMGLDGQNPLRLASISGDLACSSLDSSTIYFSSMYEGQRSMWIVSINGGEARRLSEKMGFRSKISPDGTRIAFFYRADSKAPWQLAVMPVNEDRILQIFELPKTVSLSSQFAWTNDGKGLILIDSRDAINNLWLYPLDGQTPTQLTRLVDDSFNRLVNFAFSPNGEQIAITRGRRVSDAVLITSP